MRRGETSHLRPGGEAICAASRTKGGPATSTLCSRHCCSPQSSEVQPGYTSLDWEEIEVHQREVLYLFYLLIHCLVCVFAEELFSLGPEELGCLEDKEKAGAKVSAGTVGVTKDVMSV